MDGTIVSSFTPELPIIDNGTNNGTYKIEVQNDNKKNCCRRKYVNRYNFDRTLDTSFPILESSTAGYPLLTCKLQSDEKY